MSEVETSIEPPEVDDPEVADALLRCLRSIAAHRGPGLQVAIQQAIGELP